MSNHYFALFLLFMSTVYSNSVVAEQSPTISVDRGWGLLLGDEVRVDIDLTLINGLIDKSSLPQTKARYGNWLYLTNIEHLATQLVFHYQIINVPTTNTTILTPIFELKTQEDQWFEIPAAQIIIGPSLISDDIAKISAKADINPSLIDTDKIRQQLTLSIVVSLLAAAFLLIWHFAWRIKNRLPFSQAVHDLRTLPWHKTPNVDKASRILHLAFNRTSNTVVVYGEIDLFIQQHSYLKPLHDEITLFYQQSEHYFFSKQASDKLDIDMIRKLAKACRSKERLAL